MTFHPSSPRGVAPAIPARSAVPLTEATVGQVGHGSGR